MAWKFLRETANFLLGCSILLGFNRLAGKDIPIRFRQVGRQPGDMNSQLCQQKIPDGFIHFKVVNQKAKAFSHEISLTL